MHGSQLTLGVHRVLKSIGNETLAVTIHFQFQKQVHLHIANHMMVKRRLLSLVGATSIHDTESWLFSSQHTSFAPPLKSPNGFQSPSRLIDFISLYRLSYTPSKENCIHRYNTAPFFHLNSYASLSTSATAPNAAIKCWACGTEAPHGPFLACPSCKSVQPLISSVNYFHIFNLEPGYDVDSKDLEKKYKDWQKKLHPDLFQRKSEQEKEYSAQQSAEVIKAYNTLLKPLSRAEYMLQLQGIHVDQERTVTDPELLMEIMEVRESVEDADNDDALKSIQTKMQSKLEECQMSFATAYEKRDFTSAVSAIEKMSYYERVNAEIIKKL